MPPSHTSATVRDVSREPASPLAADRPDLRAVRVDQTDAGVRLVGVVRSFYLKQVAQETVARLRPAERIENAVRVDRSLDGDWD